MSRQRNVPGTSPTPRQTINYLPTGNEQTNAALTPNAMHQSKMSEERIRNASFMSSAGYFNDIFKKRKKKADTLATISFSINWGSWLIYGIPDPPPKHCLEWQVTQWFRVPISGPEESWVALASLTREPRERCLLTALIIILNSV